MIDLSKINDATDKRLAAIANAKEMATGYVALHVVPHIPHPVVHTELFQHLVDDTVTLIGDNLLLEPDMTVQDFMRMLSVLRNDFIESIREGIES